MFVFFFFQAEDGIRDYKVTGVQTCALPIFILSSEKRRQAAVLHKNLRWARNVRRATWPLGPDGGRAFATAACRSFSLSTVRSEERRVGKEGRSRWSPYH